MPVPSLSVVLYNVEVYVSCEKTGGEGEEGVHICIPAWMRIGVGLLTRISNEQTQDEIILRFGGN